MKKRSKKEIKQVKRLGEKRVKKAIATGKLKKAMRESRGRHG